MGTRRFVGLLILGNSALITTITTVTVTLTVAAVFIVSTGAYCSIVDTMSKNVSLMLANSKL